MSFPRTIRFKILGMFAILLFIPSMVFIGILASTTENFNLRELDGIFRTGKVYFDEEVESLELHLSVAARHIARNLATDAQFQLSELQGVMDLRTLADGVLIFDESWGFIDAWQGVGISSLEGLIHRDIQRALFQVDFGLIPHDGMILGVYHYKPPLYNQRIVLIEELSLNSWRQLRTLHGLNYALFRIQPLRIIGSNMPQEFAQGIIQDILVTESQEDYRRSGNLNVQFYPLNVPWFLDGFTQGMFYLTRVRIGIGGSESIYVVMVVLLLYLISLAGLFTVLHFFIIRRLKDMANQIILAGNRVSRGVLPQLEILNSDDEIGAIGRIVHDLGLGIIEERRRLNKVLEEYQKQENLSNSAARSFFQQISHEIRSPLQGIIGFSQLLQERLKKNSPDQGYIQVVLSESERLRQIIDQAIELSKIEAGVSVLRSDPFQIPELFSLIETNLSAGQNQKTNPVLFSSEIHSPTTLFGDVALLARAWVFIIQILVKGGVEGSLLFSVTRENFDKEFLTIQFTLAYGGVELSEEMRQSMSILSAQKILHLMGGEVLYLREESAFGSPESVAQQLVRTVLVLPYSREVVDAGMNPELSIPPNKSMIPGLRVLVAMPRGFSRQYMVEVLQSIGCVVVTADDGPSAIRSAQQNPPSVLLVSIIFSGMSGIEIAEALGKSKSTRSIPLIALDNTGISSGLDVRVIQGFSEILPIPVTGQVLIKGIQTVLHRSGVVWDNSDDSDGKAGDIQHSLYLIQNSETIDDTVRVAFMALQKYFILKGFVREEQYLKLIEIGILNQESESNQKKIWETLWEAVLEGGA